MSFEEYMNENLPNWKNELSLENIQNLQQLYNKMNESQKIRDNVLNLQFSSKAGIDYSTDYQKASSELINAKMAFENSLNNIIHEANESKFIK